MRQMKTLVLAISILFFFCFTATCQNKISIEAKPNKIFIEQGEDRQYLNFDFLVTNNTSDTVTLIKVKVLVFNKNNKLVYSRFLDNNGTAPSITLIQNREFPNGVSHLVFNPFTDFSLTMPIPKLVYEWTFTKNNDEEVKDSSVVYPQKYTQQQALNFPLKGRVFVYDAHDQYAHHRRFDYEFAPIKQLGLSANFMRYAYDLVILDSNNLQYKGDSEKDENYFGFGKAIYAVGDGKVIYASNDHKDDKSFDIPGIAKKPLELYGNCIAIQHADSSVSVYGHLKQNSIKVKKGEMVKAKQQIAAIGVSGSSFFPHLHFEMRTSITSSAEGLPSYFSNVYLLEPKRKLTSGLAETGNIIEAE